MSKMKKLLNEFMYPFETQCALLYESHDLYNVSGVSGVIIMQYFSWIEDKWTITCFYSNLNLKYENVYA
jgi:hypothetical protein